MTVVYDEKYDRNIFDREFRADLLITF